MTLIEIERAIKSYNRQQQQKAYYDYTLADLIGISVARIYSKKNKMPKIYEAYPTLFDKEEIEKQQMERIKELSVLRFKQFVDAHNTKYD